MNMILEMVLWIIVNWSMTNDVKVLGRYYPKNNKVSTVVICSVIQCDHWLIQQFLELLLKTMTVRSDICFGCGGEDT